jgi:hypothetical protein
MTEDTADAWIASWEAKAARDGLERGSAYWQAGWGGSPSSGRRGSDHRYAPAALGDWGLTDARASRSQNAGQVTSVSMNALSA